MLSEINIIINNEGLSEVLERVFEVIFLEVYEEPEDEDGHMEYSIPGKVFATNGSGGEFTLLEDGSIGFNSNHGCMGRIAENVNEFLELIINCPYWERFVEEKEYQSVKQLQKFAKEKLNELETDMSEDGIVLLDEQKRVANSFKVELYEEIAQEILMRLYITSKRSPLYEGVYTEKDGSKNYIIGCVFATEF